MIHNNPSLGLKDLQQLYDTIKPLADFVVRKNKKKEKRKKKKKKKKKERKNGGKKRRKEKKRKKKEEIINKWPQGTTRVWNGLCWEKANRKENLRQPCRENTCGSQERHQFFRKLYRDLL